MPPGAVRREALSEIAFGAVCLAEEIVNTDLIKPGEPDQNFIRQRLHPGLQIAVLPLGDADGVGHFLLGQVVVLP